MLEIVASNYLLWINILIPISIGIYLVLTTGDYSGKEFMIQSFFTVFVLFVAFLLGYYSQDITTKSYESGAVSKIVYEEEWTELVTYQESYSCGTSKSPRTCYRTKTRHDHHPDEYYLVHSFGSTSISRSQWDMSKEEFGFNQTDSGHMNQVSFGDGRTYTAVPNKIIPVGNISEGINYVYAAKSNIIKSAEFKDLEKRYGKELVAYPTMFEDHYGQWNYHRVINPQLCSTSEAIDKDLQDYASYVGPTKEVNPMVYFTTADSKSMAYVIKGFYRDAHKNDAMLVVGIDTNGSVKWTSAFGFTKSAEFVTHNEDLKGTPQEVVKQFKNNINLYWKRTPMEEYKYLSGDIDLPLWFEIVVVLVNIVGSFFIFRYMLANRL